MEGTDIKEIDGNYQKQYGLLELIRAKKAESISENIDGFIMQKYGKEGLLEEESKSHDPDLQCYLGLLAEKEENMEESWEWHEKSAGQGNVLSQWIFGRHYNARFGWTHKDEDLNKAIGWFEKASSQGDVLSSFELISCYEDRNGNEDFEKAVEVYEKLLARNDESRVDVMGRLYNDIFCDAKSRKFRRRIRRRLKFFGIIKKLQGRK